MTKPSRERGRGLLALASATALLAVLVTAPAAQAAYDPLGSGTTKLSLERSFLAFLKRDEVALTATAPAERRGRKVTFPVSGGLMDPTTGKGTIEAEGGLVFKSASKRVPLRDLTIKTKHSPLIAKVGGSQLKVASAAKLSSKRDGFGTDFSTGKLKLSAKVAERLNKKLRPKQPFKAGQLIGSTVSKAQPQTVTILAANKATLTLSPETVAKLNSRFVSVNPIFPAEHVGPTFTLPIVPGGAIAPDAQAGTLETGGSIEFLQLGSNAQIFWHEFWFELAARVASPELDAEPAPPFGGKAGRVAVLGLDLPATSVAANPRARTIATTTAPLSFGAATAALFDEAFAERKEVFKAGEALGTLSFTAQGQ